ncbi:hypothetical protein KZX50_00330 [Bacillus infantis]|nr:hypothetical protein [Bacillus infantis]MCK6203893.1 hypothetical protein [Bacillus infantis]
MTNTIQSSGAECGMAAHNYHKIENNSLNDRLTTYDIAVMNERALQEGGE